MKSEALISVVNTLGLSDATDVSDETNLHTALSHYLNELINTDFNKLVSILYRMDVSESKVRQELANASSDTSAGEIIARLLIEREQQKIEWRRKYKNGEL